MAGCLVNGTVSVGVASSNRGLAYGDGLFETIAVFAGKPRLWQAHMDRLAEGCDRLGIEPPAQATLLQEARAVSGDQPACVVKIIVSRGAGGRGYEPGLAPGCDRVVSAHPFPEDLESQAGSGVEARVLDMRLALQPALGGIKHLNRLEQVLAARELSGFAEQAGILLDHEGYVISAISANLFLVQGERLLTPRMDRCGVRGVLRGVIVQEFKSRCELRRVTVDMLAEADEVFLCSAIRGIIPVTRIDTQGWLPGRVTRDLQYWFERLSGTA